MRLTHLLYLACFLIAYSCVPPAEKNLTDIDIDLTSDKQRQIIDWKDRRMTDSLLFKLTSSDVTERYLAVEAFGSVKSPSAIDPLITILEEDPSDDVRLQAAYALGQIGDARAQNALTVSFGRQDTSQLNSDLRRTILEAVGKVGDQKSLDLIVGISTYNYNQDKLLLGQMQAIYRFAQRNITSQKAVDLVIEKVIDSNIPSPVKILGANYLSRFLKEPSTAQIEKLVAAIPQESNPEIRMGIANALAKTGNNLATSALQSIIMLDGDPRVRSNVLRSLSPDFYPAMKDSLFQLVLDQDLAISDLACKAIVRSRDRRNAGIFLNLAKGTSDHVRKASYLSAAITPIPAGYVNTRNLINIEVKEGLQNARTSYERANYVEVLAADPSNYNVFRSEGLFASEPVVQTRSITAVSNLLTNIRTLGLYRTPSRMQNFKSLILADLDSLINSGDPGVIAAAATVIKNPDIDFKSQIELVSPYRRALRNLKLPEETESQYELLSLLEYLEDTTYTKPSPAFNHPIDWTQLENISDSSEAYIITPKGQIKVQLLPTHAPGSVANFIQLAQSNYFDGKYFHRVVPNFVIQGGCSRGDGYGGLDYSIRSEIGPKYYDGPGYIGMASAGIDTEGTQWFITHSATPHLDGRYTIFGRVAEGMDVVDDIVVGDIIQDVRILKN